MIRLFSQHPPHKTMTMKKSVTYLVLKDLSSWLKHLEKLLNIRTVN